jgi:hypothetical protein
LRKLPEKIQERPVGDTSITAPEQPHRFRMMVMKLMKWRRKQELSVLKILGAQIPWGTTSTLK